MNEHAPPEKGKGASPAPIPNPFNSPTTTAGRAAVQVCDPTPLICAAQDDCEHSDTRIAIEPPGSVHFAREVCCNCDRVLRFVPKPQTVECWRFNAFRLVKLVMCDQLSPWERMFVRDVSQRRKLSPKQLAIIDRLCTQYLTRNKFPSFEGNGAPRKAAFGALHHTRRTKKTNEKEKKTRMKSNQVFPSRWFKAADLEPNGEVVTIRKTVMEEIGEERERKPVMTFEETDQALVINITNWNSIAELTGKDDSDDWPGHAIKLVRVKVPFGKKTVDAVRVEAADVERSLGKGEIPY
jgi:hypothetical protein